MDDTSNFTRTNICPPGDRAMDNTFEFPPAEELGSFSIGYVSAVAVR